MKGLVSGMTSCMKPRRRPESERPASTSTRPPLDEHPWDDTAESSQPGTASPWPLRDSSLPKTGARLYEQQSASQRALSQNRYNPSGKPKGNLCVETDSRMSDAVSPRAGDQSAIQDDGSDSTDENSRALDRWLRNGPIDVPQDTHAGEGKRQARASVVSRADTCSSKASQASRRRSTTVSQI